MSNEADTCRRYVVPKLQAAGWDQEPHRLNEQVSFSNPLPRANVTVSVRKRNGRGRVSVVQQPNQSNNYTAIVKIDDDKGGADDYEIEMEWR